MLGARDVVMVVTYITSKSGTIRTPCAQLVVDMNVSTGSRRDNECRSVVSMCSVCIFCQDS